MRETWHEAEPFTIHIPARPYLPFFGSGAGAILQPAAERKLIDIVAATIDDLIY